MKIFNMTRQIIMAAVVVLLSGCSAYRSFKTPEIKAENICGEEVGMQQDTSVNVPSWREMFTDQCLQTLIGQALDANSDLQIARLNIEQAEAMLRASKLAYLPSFMFSPEGSISGFKGSKASYAYNLPVTMQWELDVAGRLRNRKEQAKADYLQSTEYARLVQTQLISAVANSYYTLIMIDEQLRITGASVANQKSNLETIIALKEAGLQNETAVNQATASYYDVQASQSDLLKQISNVENSIALLVNQPSKRIERSSFLPGNLWKYNLADGISLSALANRPDVKSSEYALRSSFYGVNVAHSAFYPSIVLGGNAGWTNNVGAIANPGGLLLSAIGSLTQPLFNRGVNRANLKIARAQYEQSLIAFQKSLLVAGTEVNDALTLCQSSAEKLNFRVRQIEANEKALANSEEIMRHSSGTYLDVLINQNALLMSQLVQVADWFEGVQGQINLYKALGGGVK